MPPCVPVTLSKLRTFTDVVPSKGMQTLRLNSAA
jgi:hypothetical protein